MSELSISADRLLFSQSRNRWWRTWDTAGGLGPLVEVLDKTMPRRGPMFGYCPSLLIAFGWVVLLLRRKIDFPILYWSLMAAILAWLPLGTEPGVQLLHHLPGLSAIRALYRFCIPLAMALAILSAILCRELFGKPAIRSRGAAWKPALCILLALLTWLEYWKAPLKVSDPPPIPAPYLAGGAVREASTALAGGESLIELPYWASGGDFWVGASRYETLYHQTFHQLPLVGGHHSRITRQAVPWAIFDPALVWLADSRPEQAVPPSSDQLRRTFSRHRIRFATLTRTCYTTHGESLIRGLLEGELGGKLIHEDQHCLTFVFAPSLPTNPATSSTSAR